jgi:hypothetical protein
MKCEVCGQDYGLAHNCAGIAAAAEVSDVPAPPEGFALFHYLQEAFRIATWDNSAIRRTINDPRALQYGLLVYLVISLLPSSYYLVRLISLHDDAAKRVAIGMAIGLPLGLAFDLGKIGICHLLAKWFSGANGKFTQLLPPLFLGYVVFLLALFPYFGFMAAALAWICVFVMVFQEVDDLEYLTAFLYSASVNVALIVISIFMMPLHNR